MFFVLKLLVTLNYIIYLYFCISYELSKYYFFLHQVNKAGQSFTRLFISKIDILDVQSQKELICEIGHKQTISLQNKKLKQSTNIRYLLLIVE